MTSRLLKNAERSRESMVKYLLRETRYTEDELKAFSDEEITKMFKEEKNINYEEDPMKPYIVKTW